MTDGSCICGKPWGAIIPPPPCPEHGQTIKIGPYPVPGISPSPEWAREWRGVQPDSISIHDALRRIDELERRVKELEGR